MPRKPKGSSARFVHGGESGPKIRPKGVVDGQQVNIPVLPLVGPEGTEEARDLRQGQSQVQTVFMGRRPPKGNGGVHVSSAGRRLALECKGRRELGLQDPPVEQGRKSALVIRRCRVEGPSLNG
ncbi:hypothetical protein HAX54_034016 [Datura stramonium]|uniref:Uncharacterized protein n=1 Tax=Datura stramonium TaxID=4076 RepID=A0ABS8VEW2_DATST|nr:hypothetical protein [Datura stramonium]